MIDAKLRSDYEHSLGQTHEPKGRRDCDRATSVECRLVTEQSAYCANSRLAEHGTRDAILELIAITVGSPSLQVTWKGLNRRP